MSSSDDNRDVSRRAQSTLDYILADEEGKAEAFEESQMPVTQALYGDQVVRFSSNRTSSRVLFLTEDADVLKDDSKWQTHFLDIASVFAEVHVAVLKHGKKREYPTKRLAKNVWLYTVNFSSSWFLSHVMESFAESQLQFGDGFRPDVIVALEPYFAGSAALMLGKQYDRPVQVHVFEDFTTESFAELSKEHKRKRKLAFSVLKKVNSVRTNSNLIKSKLEEHFPKVEDLGMLPRHFDTDSLVKTKRTNTLKEKYPQYVFIMLTAGVLDHNNTVYRTLDAARSLLFSPRIALIVMGEGPMRGELQKRAEIFGIKEQVIFEANTALLPDYMLSADMFICTDTSNIGDEYVMQAAAAGLPIVMAKTPLREDLFVDGQSGVLCNAEDITAFTKGINTILNTNAFRVQYAKNARTVVKDRLHTNPDMYRAAYRDTIEVVFGKTDIRAVVEATEATSDIAPDAPAELGDTREAAPQGAASPNTPPATPQPNAA